MIHLPAERFTPSIWRNGLGRSWEIASAPEGVGPSDPFLWRFAIAEITADSAFSHYEATDRIFTLLEGPGLTLSLAGGQVLDVVAPYQPVAFPGDVATACRLKGGVCRVLKLLLTRGAVTAAVSIHHLTDALDLPASDGPVLVFALQGAVRIDGQHLAAGDAMRLDHGPRQVSPLAGQAMLYLAALRLNP